MGPHWVILPGKIAGIWKKSFSQKKIHRGYEKPVFCDFFTPNGVVTFSVWSVNLEPSTQWQSQKRPEVDILGRSRRPVRVAFSPPTPNWPAVTVTVRKGKVPQTQTYTSRDTSRHGRCDGELAGTCGGLFAEIGTGLCEADVHRFQTSEKGPKASWDLV